MPVDCKSEDDHSSDRSACDQEDSRLRDQMLRSLLSVVDALGRPSAYSSDPDPTESMAAAASRVMPTGRTLWAADTETLDLDRLRLLAHVKTLRERLRRIGSTEVVADFDFKHPWLVAELEAAGASDFAISGSDHMSNEQLAHEVLLEPSYRLSADDDTEGKSALENKRAFWAGVEEELLVFGCVLRVLCQVRDGVAAVAPPPVKTDLFELVDEDLIRQQVDKGLYGWKECVDLISNITTIICRIHTPERRAQTDKVWAAVKEELEAADVSVQSQQLCRGLQFLLARANVERVDVGNHWFRYWVSRMERGDAAQHEVVDFDFGLFLARFELEQMDRSLCSKGVSPLMEMEEALSPIEASSPEGPLKQSLIRSGFTCGGRLARLDDRLPLDDLAGTGVAVE
jgi:hypothetical protein